MKCSTVPSHNNNCQCVGSYMINNYFYTRKIIDNVVELEESSQNFNLYGNKLQVAISDEVILPNLIIHESDDKIFIFIATTRSIHQLIFAHPTHQKYVSRTVYTVQQS